jgi:hypothetical protein|tara:strand:+ start:2805 stop:3731 length:927 start_codon:yes stop_codon:yes gene_type:complete
MKNNVYYLLLAFTFFSCERIIPFSPEDTDPKITIYALTSVEAYGTGFGAMTDSVYSQPIDAALSQSISILDNSNPTPLNSAAIWVVDLNTLQIDTLIPTNMDQGFFRSPNMQVKEGHSYNFHAKYGTLDSVFASSEVPAVPQNIVINPLDTNTGNSSGGPGSGEEKPYISFDIEINDDGAPGYYMIQAYERLVNTITVPEDMMYMESDDPSITSSGDRWGGDMSLYVSNNLFLGEKRIFNLKVIGYPEPDMQKVFKIVKMDNDYYNYLSSFDLYQGSGGPFSQPVTVYSNVTNGLGLVSGTSALWIAP